MFEASTESPQPKAGLVNPNVISKKYDSQNRQEVAKNILQARSEQRTLRTLPVQAEDSKEKKAQIQLNLDEKEAQLQARMNSLLVRLKTGIGIKDEQVVQMEADLQTLQTLKQLARDELNALREKIFLLEAKLNLTPSPSPKEILNTYNEKMLGKPLTNEEKRRLLTPEVLILYPCF